MEEALLSYAQSSLRVVREQDIIEKKSGVEVNLQGATPVQKGNVSYCFPRISMPEEPAGYIKVNKYDCY